ncbi:hypothetical protein COEREDRAFT_85259 [Coemansia reversa NRRL 1564]|uniref:Uncharacterized protein n=1 Tax=Coemansia reversa (strain ATCC 12441 / NRRL 1564) TaxID=763665 RepID=A0A2G5BGX2_COERN|nr:hypothetical protein COEREDRAFT_85259 [Coemansia reversa NRRL 1564]|eukprot:PIA18270.1 hypothetical protein COEREDRAFT_85259 [Coemansia reversa NRRL 1564]
MKTVLRFYKLYLTLVLIGCGIGGALRMAIIWALQGRAGYVIDSQAARAIAIAVWSLFFMIYTWWSGNSKFPIKARKRRKSKFRTIAFFMTVIPLIQYGDPLLSALYIGKEGITSVLGISDGFYSTVDPYVAFDANVAINNYTFLTGIAVAIASFKIPNK